MGESLSEEKLADMCTQEVENSLIHIHYTCIHAANLCETKPLCSALCKRRG